MNGLLNIDPATSYFPTPERCSIIGSSRLNFRVRDGNGCDPTDRITGKLFAREPGQKTALLEQALHKRIFNKP